MSDNKIGSGRTSRLLLEARALARDGKTVIVVCASLVHIRQSRSMLIKLLSEPYIVNPMGWVMLQPTGSGIIKFLMPDDDFNWNSLQFRPYLPSNITLVDHYTLESFLGRALDMLYKYDSKGAEL